jgi:hypothetical protein
MALAFLTKINAATGKAFSDGMPSSRCANARIYRAFDGKINPSPSFFGCGVALISAFDGKWKPRYSSSSFLNRVYKVTVSSSNGDVI